MRRPIALLLCAAACGSATEPTDHVHLRVAGASFALDAEHTACVPYSIVNGGSTPVYVAACGDDVQPGFAIDGRGGGGAGICLANVLAIPIEVPAHGALADTAVASRSGATRLEVLVRATRDARRSVTIRSASFEVR
jgi:hypothetical protein